MDDDFDITTAPDKNQGYTNSGLGYVLIDEQFTTGGTVLNATSNHSLVQDVYWKVNDSVITVCNSNASSFWKLTTPLCSTRFETFASFMIVLIVLSLIILCTIIGNTLVVLALYRYRSLRTMSNCLIGNLAISDLLLSMTVMPISTGNDLLGYWVFGRTMCTMWLCMDVLYCTASIWGLCTIAFDRYTATVYPMWYHDQRSMRKVVAYIVFVWIFSIIISFAPFIGWQDMIPSFYYFNAQLNRHECILFSTQSYVFYSALGSFVLPGLLMVFLYIRIFSVLHDQSSSLKARDTNISCLSPQSPRCENGCPQVNSPDDNSIELNMTRENTALTVVGENLNSSTLYINGNTFNPTDIIKVLDNDENTDYASDGDLLDETPSCDNLDPGRSDSTGNYLLVSNGPNNDYKRVHNGTRKSCSDAIDLQKQKSPSSSDNTLRSKSVNILADLSSDDCSVTRSRDKKAKKPHRFSLPWNISNLERNQRMSLSMKRRFELREQRATKRMLLIMACFFVCWIPFLFMYITRSLCADCYMNDHFVAFIIWLGYANSGVNPILYTLFNEDFRRAFKKLLGFDTGRLP